jgi:hypothetical protein
VSEHRDGDRSVDALLLVGLLVADVGVVGLLGVLLARALLTLLVPMLTRERQELVSCVPGTPGRGRRLAVAVPVLASASSKPVATVQTYRFMTFLSFELPGQRRGEPDAGATD